jgi:hypothetical protein
MADIPRSLVAISMMFIVFGIASCGEVERELGKGYILYETNAATIAIYRDISKRDVDPDPFENIQLMVGALVHEYAVIGECDYIVGVVRETHRVSELKATECVGWFVIICDREEVICGMTTQQWRETLDGLGIDVDKVKLRHVK